MAKTTSINSVQTANKVSNQSLYEQEVVKHVINLAQATVAGHPQNIFKGHVFRNYPMNEQTGKALSAEERRRFCD